MAPIFAVAACAVHPVVGGAERCMIVLHAVAGLAGQFREELMGYTSTILAILALAISAASFFRGVFKDRLRLKITSSFDDGQASPYGPKHAPSIDIVVINAGTRPVILRMVGGSDDDDHWGGSGMLIAHEKGGIRLGEHERWEHSIKNEDTVDQYSDDPRDILFTHMWIEDSLGNRYPIPNSYELVPKLQATLFVRPPAEINRDQR
jgi:hypothetical protein